MEAFRAITADGVRLALRRFAPQGERRGVILCTHAMMARGAYFHRGPNDGFAGHLGRRGLEVYVLDWRGHGDSRPPSPRGDDWSFDDYVDLDLPAALAAVCERSGVAVEEMTYLGHSLGGLVGLAAMGTGRVPLPRRLALWATSVWLPGPGGSLWRRGVMAAYGLSARALGYAPVRALRAGSDDEPRGYVEQLTGWASSGRWTSRIGVDYLAGLPSIECPAWPVVGAGDRLCRADDARELARRLPEVRDMRIVGRHSGDRIDPDHFSLFTSTELASVWDELVDFIAC